MKSRILDYFLGVCGSQGRFKDIVLAFGHEPEYDSPRKTGNHLTNTMRESIRSKFKQLVLAMWFELRIEPFLITLKFSYKSQNTSFIDYL